MIIIVTFIIIIIIIIDIFSSALVFCLCRSFLSFFFQILMNVRQEQRTVTVQMISVSTPEGATDVAPSHVPKDLSEPSLAAAISE